MSNYLKVVTVAGLCAAFLIGGALLLTPTKAATSLADAASLSESNEYQGVVNQFPSLRVGKQDVGGVTFFNGTIINTTVDEEGNDIPVTFGDDVRIDGRVRRGPEPGPGDPPMPFIIDDQVEITGDAFLSGFLVMEPEMYLTLGTTDAAPDAEDCDAEVEAGRTIVQPSGTGAVDLWICDGVGGWVAK